MGQRADGKYGGVDGESYTKYGEKTSEHGHWEVGASFAGTNPNGEKWQNQRMEWVEDDRNAWDMDYRDLRALGNNNDSSPSPEAEPQPQPEAPANDPQELLESYKQDITANNSTEVEKVGSNLNTDLINSMETTDNNQFGSKTFSAVPTADKAAQNFLTDKKQLVLKSFK